MRGQKSVQRSRALLQSFQEEADVVEFLRVGRVFQKFDGFLVGSSLFLGNVLESEVLIGRVVREQHAVVKRELRPQIVPENNVREFMREDGCEAGLIRKDVDQST